MMGMILSEIETCKLAYLILVTTTTTGGGVLFQAGVLFSSENAKGTAFTRVYSKTINTKLHFFCDEVH